MKAKRSPVMFILLLLAGMILGSALWSMLSPVLPPALAQSFSIGSTGAPWKLDLMFIVLTFGVVLSVNIGSLLGMILAVVVFYKL